MGMHVDTERPTPGQLLDEIIAESKARGLVLESVEYVRGARFYVVWDDGNPNPAERRHIARTFVIGTVPNEHGRYVRRMCEDVRYAFAGEKATASDA